jgi:hypothetical protein
MRRAVGAVLSCSLLAGMLAAGCSSAAPGGQATVLSVAGGFSQGAPASTIDTVDIGVPQAQNLTGQSVRVEGVKLASLPPAAHLVSVTVYAPGPGVGVMFGNLVSECQANKPYPVAADVTPAHVIAIRFTKPGRYYVRHVKIYYLTDGHRGWQYQNLDTTMIISAPRKGAKPQFNGCLPPD